ncbi:hypothetical protein SD074_18900 [Prolixibacter sp. SD074]|nr:hypothetical protein SD074_18900 [Prolixibacter sp. SD074]
MRNALVALTLFKPTLNKVNKKLESFFVRPFIFKIYVKEGTNLIIRAKTPLYLTIDNATTCYK